MDCKFFLGLDKDGFNVFENMATMPHLLIAGNTGCGKSVLLNQIFKTIDCGCILIDPKLVEFEPLKNWSKVYKNRVFSSDADITYILGLLSVEMQQRYEYLTKHGFKNIYNADDHYKPITVFFDEYADMTTAQRKQMIHLLRLGRAAGIHFIIATQRPSARIISGDIKANVTCRCAMHCMSKTDSRIIIDGFSGAVDLPDRQGYFYYTNGDGNINLMRSVIM